MKGSDDLIQLGHDVRSLGAVLEEARLSDPMKVKLAYHTVVDNLTQEDKVVFTATLNYRHAWRSEPGEVQTSPEGGLVNKPCAGWFNREKWDNAATALTWIMKWTTKGLTPVRPIVIAKHTMTFKPKEHVQF